MKPSLLIYFLLLFSNIVFAQNCPSNIGFEDGTFTGWKCYAGTNKDGAIEMTETGPINGRHTLLLNTSPQMLDPYGGFPINSPNGSRYTLQLGSADSRPNARIESVTYDLVIPNNHYTLTYYYAVVLQNPDHLPEEQPKFIAKVEDITGGPPITIANNSLQCGNHEFVASSGLPGFQADGIYQYKPWSPVSLTLDGYQGRTIRFTFIANDCTHEKHFGYAYLDFEEDCESSGIKGNYHCAGTNEVVLTAPTGYATYSWFKASDMSMALSTEPVLRLSPIPNDGTQYALEVTPPPGLGCPTTFYTTISGVAQPFRLTINGPVTKCKADGADLTDPDITRNSSADMEYKYYLDPDGQTYVPDPRRVTESGTYYIRGTNTIYGCTDIKPVIVNLVDGPDIKWEAPDPVCYPGKIDLTSVVTDPAGSTITYHADPLCLQPFPVEINPRAIDVSGTYYIKGTSTLSCATIIPVHVVINQLPVVTPQTVKSCPPISLTQAVSGGDYTGYTYQFFYDGACTRPLPNYNNLTAPIEDVTYYYRAISNGCPGLPSTVKATVYKVPRFTVVDPPSVTFPASINLADVSPPQTDAAYTYWYDAAATKKISDYRAVGQTGTYYIQAMGLVGNCTYMQPVHIVVNAPPEAGLVAANTFTPNGDGVNDFFNPTTTGVININYLKIFNRYGKQVYETKQSLTPWDGKIAGQMQPTGTYYWVFNCYDIYRKKAVTRSGPITIIR